MVFKLQTQISDRLKFHTPIKVFSIFKPGALRRVVVGEDEGTLVHV